MKNIHVLPTDKPSRLYIDNKGKYNLEIGQVDFKTNKIMNEYQGFILIICLILIPILSKKFKKKLKIIW